MFILSIGIGSLLLIALEYVGGADWSVPIRRVVEFLSSTIIFLPILVLPLVFSIHDIFHWAHTDVVAKDEILKAKSSYLNEAFFIIRVFAVLAVWGLFYYLLIRNSNAQDITKDQLLTKKNIILSAIFIPVFAITITITAVDWLMSLEPHWFSTIFGVYFFSGSVIASLAAITLFVVFLKEKGFMHPKLIDDHLFSLGALQFAFVNFWAYIAFSQYMLIWYANLPEENFWFLQRWENGWQYLSILLIIAHFIVPYAALLSQPAKMDPKRLKFISVWILFAHFIDLYWLVMPNVNGYYFSLIDIVVPLIAVGLIILVFNYRAKKSNLVPIGDPKLQKGLDFRVP
ncbi:MAG: quinol:cytochrome C oxidoreductase [Ignavibacteria bacterium RIFOXYB2_FULL_35_12]|nr:MAG: quinol:cytochrome C oxidoreductase [Ignavibacteria bacterium GWA2_36_19]OGU59386.1 MAG: quinol:cytochrome C oxidoreductase [Ignavibacteria bacterium GWF2_35_20]OGU78950.1 MAG: quinol:cytochrome C oxidoreductase [Ignavibacteria bacterium RIFOXYA2_FULL_35_9]OGU86535.1 MAG: quinol:cytochrome C oxidoreductase [Ignavibacteria bacterium RIFOXYA12_FULL_35_25]OGU92366.1 MAG: quinol:cytochrome C oxidoreductase [Ignavibacteria bacterium RIFOXYC12_FULL_35_11]OGU97784.1 MAG: quinol:cytochrome C ox